MDMTQLAVVSIVTVAGFVRGTTGFGGAMLMSPILSILIGPVPTVVTALLLETAAALVMFPEAFPQARWRTLLYLILPAVFTVPLGGYLLLTLDPAIARKLIAAVVVIFTTMLLFGVRYTGSPRVLTSVALGSVVGALLGATSVGAPPVILYFAVGPRSCSRHARQSNDIRYSDFSHRPGHACGCWCNLGDSCNVSDCIVHSVSSCDLARRQILRAFE